jgi:hypothetical protein
VCKIARGRLPTQFVVNVFAVSLRERAGKCFARRSTCAEMIGLLSKLRGSRGKTSAVFFFKSGLRYRRRRMMATLCREWSSIMVGQPHSEAIVNQSRRRLDPTGYILDMQGSEIPAWRRSTRADTCSPSASGGGGSARSLEVLQDAKRRVAHRVESSTQLLMPAPGLLANPCTNAAVASRHQSAPTFATNFMVGSFVLMSICT